MLQRTVAQQTQVVVVEVVDQEILVETADQVLLFLVTLLLILAHVQEER